MAWGVEKGLIKARYAVHICNKHMHCHRSHILETGVIYQKNLYVFLPTVMFLNYCLVSVCTATIHPILICLSEHLERYASVTSFFGRYANYANYITAARHCTV